MKEAPLRKSYERILLHRAESGGDRSACPSIEGMQALIARQGPEAERLTRLDHVMGCPFCREEFELLRTVRSAAPAAPGLSLRMLALAASIVLVLGTGLFLRLSRRPLDTPRGGAESVVLLTPAEGATISGIPAFAWRPVAGALRYRLELLRPDGVVVWRRELSDTTGALPDGSLVEPGVEYRWQVEAESNDGAVRRSEMHRFSVRSP